MVLLNSLENSKQYKNAGKRFRVYGALCLLSFQNYFKKLAKALFCCKKLVLIVFIFAAARYLWVEYVYTLQKLLGDLWFRYTATNEYSKKEEK